MVSEQNARHLVLGDHDFDQAVFNQGDDDDGKRKAWARGIQGNALADNALLDSNRTTPFHDRVGFIVGQFSRQSEH